MLTLQLLGGFTLAGEAGPIEVPEGSARVIAFLGLRNSSASRPRLAGSLWPNVEIHRALGNLRSAIWRLPTEARHAIERCDDKLAIGRHLRCDVHSIDDWAGDAFLRSQARAFGPELCAELLPGWYDDWVLLERERLALRRAELFERLSHEARQRGHLTDAIHYAIASIKVEPLRESAHRALISAQAAQGNYVEVLRSYQAVASLLERELGVPLSEATTRVVVACGLRPGDATAFTMSAWGR